MWQRNEQIFPFVDVVETTYLEGEYHASNMRNSFSSLNPIRFERFAYRQKGLTFDAVCPSDEIVFNCFELRTLLCADENASHTHHRNVFASFHDTIIPHMTIVSRPYYAMQSMFDIQRRSRCADHTKTYKYLRCATRLLAYLSFGVYCVPRVSVLCRLLANTILAQRLVDWILRGNFRLFENSKIADHFVEFKLMQIDGARNRRAVRLTEEEPWFMKRKSGIICISTVKCIAKRSFMLARESI